MPERLLCERHCSDNPSRYKPKETPTLERAKALLDTASKAKRKKRMEMLCDLQAHDLIVEYALKERDSIILSIASEHVGYHPPELIRHLLTQPSSYDASLVMRIEIARGNYLYAEDTIRSVYAPRRSHPLDVIEGIGFAYLRSLGGTLQKYIAVPLELYEDALRTKGPKAVAGVDRFETSGWSRAGAAAVRASSALARLDVDFDLGHVEERLADALRIGSRTSLPLYSDQTILRTRATLEWVLFDKGGPSTLESVLGLIKQDALARRLLPDVATTLLKRRDYGALKSLIRRFPELSPGHYFVQEEFCYWPLTNWLAVNGYLAEDERNRDQLKGGGLFRYWLAREEGDSPPPWWKWQ